MLYKRPNRKLWEFRTTGEDNANLKLLRHMRGRGLVGMTEYPDGNIYYLTDEGKKIAKPIAEEIDEYKTW